MFSVESTLEVPEQLERPSYNMPLGNQHISDNNIQAARQQLQRGQEMQQSNQNNQQTASPHPSQSNGTATPPSNRRRTSSIGNFTSNLFSNITNSLRNNNSNSNLSNNNIGNGNRSRTNSSASRSNNPSNNNSQSNISRGDSSGNIAVHTPSNLNISSNSFTDIRSRSISHLPSSLSHSDSFDHSNLASTPVEDSRILQGQTRSNSLSQQNNKQDPDGTFSIRLTPFIDHSSSSSGLYFSPILRKTKPSTKLPIGRYTDKVREAAQAPPGSDAAVVFKSKVVSRTHAEFIVDNDGNWFIRDLRSSSGSFLNHIRLSPAGVESAMTPINNGDVLQLGMDFKGGAEDIFKCVKMRIEMNKSWQRKANQFNKKAHEKLRTLALLNERTELSECAICLLKVKPCQAVFISPCSHCWHYKCIRPIVVKSYPQFLCPNCRETCDLEADLDEDEDDEEEEKEEINNKKYNKAEIDNDAEINSPESSTSANDNNLNTNFTVNSKETSGSITDEDLISKKTSNEC